MHVTDRRFSPSGAATVAALVVAVIAGAAGESMLAPWLTAPANAALAKFEPVQDNENRLSAGSMAIATEVTNTFVGPIAPTTIQTPAPTATPALALLPADQPYIAVVRKAGPAVVTVVNQLRSEVTPFGQVTQPVALGSGVIIDSEGHIVTNNHVVAGGDTFQVIFSDARKVPARIVGRDPVSDIAVLKVDGAVPAVATFGDSSALEPGEQVVAIGSALGNFRNTVTHGIVSGLDRTLTDSSGPSLSGLIQTDAPINHGNSGGPLLDLNGDVVGLNTVVVRTAGTTGDVAEGLGFAIPGNSVKQVTDELIRHGTIVRPYLGISYEQLSAQSAAYYGLAATQGALVRSVEPGSPALKAGLQTGDVVTALSGSTLDDEHSLAGVLLTRQVGDTVAIAVVRGQKNLNLTATLVQRPVNGQS